MIFGILAKEVVVGTLGVLLNMLKLNWYLEQENFSRGGDLYPSNDNDTYFQPLERRDNMGLLKDDLLHLENGVRHIHDDVEHVTKDFGGFDSNPRAQDLRDHLKDLDNHLHDVMSHVGHIRMETE